MVEQVQVRSFPRVTRALSWLLLVFALGACNTYTYVTARSAKNPLPQIAKAAEGKYTVTMAGDDHLELWQTWVGWCFLRVGYSGGNAVLDYRDGRVYGQFSGSHTTVAFITEHLSGQKEDDGVWRGIFGEAWADDVSEMMREVLAFGGVSNFTETHDASWSSLEDRVKVASGSR